jgi:hypothetical protein
LLNFNSLYPSKPTIKHTETWTSAKGKILKYQSKLRVNNFSLLGDIAQRVKLCYLDFKLPTILSSLLPVWYLADTQTKNKNCHTNVTEKT